MHRYRLEIRIVRCLFLTGLQWWRKSRLLQISSWSPLSVLRSKRNVLNVCYVTFAAWRMTLKMNRLCDHLISYRSWKFRTDNSAIFCYRSEPYVGYTCTRNLQWKRTPLYTALSLSLSLSLCDIQLPWWLSQAYLVRTKTIPPPSALICIPTAARSGIPSYYCWPSLVSGCCIRYFELVTSSCPVLSYFVCFFANV